MTKPLFNTSFATLFKKYRLRSEIGTLAQFGDLLAEEGMIYETSLFTKWQKGERVPKDRKIILTISRIFLKKDGVNNIQEVNSLLESAGQGYLTEIEEHELSSLKDYLSGGVLQASLGGLLKDYRTQKNITSQDLSLFLGWKDSSRLNKIEQGIEKPSRELIDEICKGLHLKVQEKNYLLLIGNYLPTLSEIDEACIKVKPFIEDWPFPAVLLDFSWRILLENNQHKKIFYILDSKGNKVDARMWRVIEILFNPMFISNIHFKKASEVEAWHEWLLWLVINFRGAHQNRISESWYVKLVSKMMENRLFAQIWKESNNKNNIIVTKYGKKFSINPTDLSKRLHFNFFVVPLLDDPRFDIEFYNPADITTINYFNK